MSAATLCGRRNLEDEVGIHQEGDEMSERANGRSQDDGDSQTSPKNEQQQCSEQLGGRELGLPIPEIRFFGPSASKAIVVEGDTDKVIFSGLEDILSEPGVQIRLFGKPEVKGHRRFGVLLATAPTVEEALAKVERAYAKLQVEVLPR